VDPYGLWKTKKTCDPIHGESASCDQMTHKVPVFALAVVLLSNGCGGEGADGDSTLTGGPAAMGGASGGDLQFCVDENNRYRAMKNVAPLQRSASLEAFGAVGAKYDYDAKKAHKHFADSNGIPGARAAAENEIPGFGGWNLGRNGTVQNVIAQGFKMMWAEGPGGGHYENMKNATYKQVGCGIYVAPNMDVTVTVDFTP
jgi:hypothetical protein